MTPSKTDLNSLVCLSTNQEYLCPVRIKFQLIHPHPPHYWFQRPVPNINRKERQSWVPSSYCNTTASWWPLPVASYIELHGGLRWNPVPPDMLTAMGNHPAPPSETQLLVRTQTTVTVPLSPNAERQLSGILPVLDRSHQPKRLWSQNEMVPENQSAEKLPTAQAPSANHFYLH